MFWTINFISPFDQETVIILLYTQIGVRIWYHSSLNTIFFGQVLNKNKISKSRFYFILMSPINYENPDFPVGPFLWEETSKKMGKFDLYKVLIKHY